MRIKAIFIILLLIVSCGARSWDKAEVECTAQLSGLVTDFIITSETSPGFGQFTVELVEDRARCELDKIDEPPRAGNVQSVGCHSHHPGYDNPLPRRFRTTEEMSY